jgi:hypothetical protein
MAVVAGRISCAHVSIYNECLVSRWRASHRCWKNTLNYRQLVQLVVLIFALTTRLICSTGGDTTYKLVCYLKFPFCIPFVPPNYATCLLILIRINIDYSLPIHSFPLWKLHFLRHYEMSLYTRILLYFTHFHSYVSTDLALATTHFHLNLSVYVQL